MPADSNVILRGDKSFVYDLDVQRGIVSSRVALLLRSAEIKPLLSDLFIPSVFLREPLYVWGGELVFDRSRPAQSVWMGCDFLSLFLFLIFLFFLSKIGGGVNGGEVLVLVVWWWWC